MEEPGLIESVTIYDRYQPTAMEPGLQPVAIPIPTDLLAGGHRDVFHLGLRRHALPHERLPETIASSYGLTIRPGPWLRPVRVDQMGHRVMHAPVGEPWAAAALRELLNQSLSGCPVTLIGTASEYSIYQSMKLDRHKSVTLRETSDLLDVWKALDGAHSFWGVASAPAVIAAASGLICRWVLRPAPTLEARAIIERCVPRGCDVSVVHCRV
jgi:hypothetical protein